MGEVAQVVVVGNSRSVVVENSRSEVVGNSRSEVVVGKSSGQNFRQQGLIPPLRLLWTFGKSSKGLESFLSSPLQMATWICGFCASP